MSIFIFYWKTETPDESVPYYGPITKANLVCIQKGNAVVADVDTIGKTVGEIKKLQSVAGYVEEKLNKYILPYIDPVDTDVLNAFHSIMEVVKRMEIKDYE